MTSFVSVYCCQHEYVQRSLSCLHTSTHVTTLNPLYMFRPCAYHRPTYQASMFLADTRQTRRVFERTGKDEKAAAARCSGGLLDYFFLVGVFVGFPGFVGVRDLVGLLVGVLVTTFVADGLPTLAVAVRVAVAVGVCVATPQVPSPVLKINGPAIVMPILITPLGVHAGPASVELGFVMLVKG